MSLFTPANYKVKSRPIQIPHEFFLNTHGNSTYVIDPWNFHMLFLQHPWKFQEAHVCKSINFHTKLVL